MVAIEVKQVSKTYNKGLIKAINDVSFQVEKGEIFGLIGPDGAGKTSLFRILTTLLLADSGKATVLGFDVVKDYRQIRNIVGYMPGRFSLYQDLTIEENLNFFATVFGTTLQENYSAIKDIYEQIEPFNKRRAGKLSGGMKQKLALCCALIHKPQILFLDEPTTGVDVVSRKEFWDMLGVLKEQGMTIVVSTPYMDEATRCDRIALMQNGHIMSIDTPEAISQDFKKQLFAIKAEDIYTLLKYVNKESRFERSYAFGEYIHLTVKNEDLLDVNEITSFLAQGEFKGLEVKIITPTIEDCFIALMNKETR